MSIVLGCNNILLNNNSQVFRIEDRERDRKREIMRGKVVKKERESMKEGGGEGRKTYEKLRPITQIVL